MTRRPLQSAQEREGSLVRILNAKVDTDSLDLLKDRLQEWGHDVLPAADGLELCRHFNRAERNRHLPFIMLSTSKEPAAYAVALGKDAEE